MSDSESDFEASGSESDGYVEQAPPTPKPKKAAGKKAAPKKVEKNGNVAAMLGVTTANDENSIPSSPAISTGSGTGTPKSKTIEEIYQKKSQLEHILLRPDTYIGSVEEQKQEMWIYENEKIVKKEISFVPGLYKIVDEILVNAADNKVRDPQMSEMRIEVDRAENRISVWNNGLGIPIEIHKEEKIYVPEMIFGHLLTSSNYDDNEEKLFGGRNGYGAKLCNIFSTEFIIRTADKERGLKYEQVFNDNMSKKKAPKITKNSKGEEYTEIIFKPDLSKFGLTELSEDFVKLLQKRAYDMAGCVKREPKPIRVKFNKEKIAINDFKKYAQLYTDSEEPIEGTEVQKKSIIFDDGAKNERWQVGFSISEGQFTQVSFVNSICTSKGGTHVNDVADKIANIIKKKVDSMRKNDKSNIKTFQIKNHMCLFINCLIPNPSFDNQTKDTMNLHRSKFIKTSEYTPSEGFIKKILSSGICDKVIKWAEFKQSQQITKADGTRIERRINVPKLDDANLAGVKGQSKHCTLILTEGDSAKALVLGGLSVVGKDKFGVFPLRGKLLNVREASQSQIIGNAEIQHIKTILGLKHGKKYTSVDELRYGSLMIMTDQDHDGSHIKGLIINFIDQMFPSLLDIPGFLLEFITPIIKCKKKGKNETISFYTIPEYEAWALVHNKNKEWTPKYFKGLGTSDRKDAREYFSNLDQHKKIFCVPDAGERELIDMAFNKKKAAERKEWLAQYEPGIFMDNSVKEIRLSNFINQELMLFSMADNIRSIPSMVDGFKPGQRKVLFGTIKSGKRGEMKVAQLASAVSEITRYHHGEQSVQATIVGMAQDFVGSNNINLLVPAGQFGTRHQGGKDAASARYINTKLSKISRTIFHVDDDPLLTYEIEENKSVEPKWYMPILPMVLVNGAEGIGTGWSTSIPNYNPRDIVDNLFRMMKDEEVVPMMPWYRGFKGEISNAGDNKFSVSGIAQVNDDATITISELPVRMWTRQFKEQLEVMRDPKDKKPDVTIQDFFDNCTDSFVEFTLYLSDEALAKVDRQGPLSTFKLQNNITTSNMVCFDSEGRLKRYDSAESILKEFYDLRLSYYQKRKARLLERLQDEYERLDNKSKFIELVIEKKLVYVNRNEQDVIRDFEEHGLKRIYPKKDLKQDILAQEDDEREETPSEDQIPSTNDTGYDYLFEINVRGFTRQKLESLRKQRIKKMEEIQICLDKSPKTFWKDDLTHFLKEWEDMLKEDANLAELGKPKTNNNKQRRYKPRAPRPKKKDDNAVKVETPDAGTLDSTTKAKSTKKAKQTKLDSMFKNTAADGETASPVEDSAMIGGPDIFMDQLESMQDMQYDYNFDDPEPSPLVDNSIPASPADAITDNTASERPSDTDASATASPNPAITSPVISLPDPVIAETTDVVKLPKKRSLAEADTTSKSKKNRIDQDNDSGDSEEKKAMKKKPEKTKTEAKKPVTPEEETLAASNSSQLDDDIDPFDYPFDATPIQSLTKNSTKAAPAPKSKPASASVPSKPSRAVKAKVKYVEIFSDDDDNDDGDAYKDDHDDDSD